MYIIESVVDVDRSEKPVALEKKERAISADPAATILKMIQAVIDKDSTGYLARVEEYNVAGKTGTAQMSDANGKPTRQVSTFVGILPADKPQIAVTVTVFNGRGTGYGGEVVAPVFPNAAHFAAWQLGIALLTEPLLKYPWYKYQIGRND